MNQVFIKILNLSISASWLILAVLVFRLVLRKAPKWIHVLLWGMVAFRLICPFSFESNISLVPSTETIPLNIERNIRPTIDSGIDVINDAVNPVISRNFAPQPATVANPLQIWISLAAVLWIVGMAVMLLYTTISYLRLRYRVATAILYRENIYQSEYVQSPFVLGIIRPCIYLPFHLECGELEHVLAHEKAHIQRKDHWWKPLGFLLLTVHWFNPLMWLAYILLCRDIELACDEKVIEKLSNEQRADYTQALVNCSVNRRQVAACPLAFGEAGVKKRVKSIMNYKKPAFWIILVSVIVCAIVGVCFLTNPSNSSEEILHMGLNAEIIHIDADNNLICVKDINKNVAVFGDRCEIDCAKAIHNKNLIYVNYAIENDVRDIRFEDLVIGDTIIITLSEAEKRKALNNCAVAEQIQLGTQRMSPVDIPDSSAYHEQKEEFTPTDKATQAYSALLSGDQSLVNNELIQWWIPDFRSNDILEYEYTYMDLDGDGMVELLVQMVDNPPGYNGVFHYADGELFCWNSDGMEGSCRDYPLIDGTMVRQYDYNGNSAYTIFCYLDNGEKEDIHYLFAREELVPEDSTEPCPYYAVDGEEVPKEVFEEQLKVMITDKVLSRELWMRN